MGGGRSGLPSMLPLPEDQRQNTTYRPRKTKAPLLIISSPNENQEPAASCSKRPREPSSPSRSETATSPKLLDKTLMNTSLHGEMAPSINFTVVAPSRRAKRRAGRLDYTSSAWPSTDFDTPWAPLASSPPSSSSLFAGTMVLGSESPASPSSTPSSGPSSRRPSPSTTSTSSSSVDLDPSSAASTSRMSMGFLLNPTPSRTPSRSEPSPPQEQHDAASSALDPPHLASPPHQAGQHQEQQQDDAAVPHLALPQLDAPHHAPAPLQPIQQQQQDDATVPHLALPQLDAPHHAPAPLQPIQQQQQDDATVPHLALPQLDAPHHAPALLQPIQQQQQQQHAALPAAEGGLRSRLRAEVLAYQEQLSIPDRLCDYYVGRDQKRGWVTSREEIKAVPDAERRRLITSPAAADIPLLLASLDDGSYPDVWPSMLQSLVPGIDMDVYANLEPADSYHLMFLAMKLVGPQPIDLVRQYWQGQVAGHWVETTSSTTRYFKRRQCQHPFVYDAIFMAMALNRILPPDEVRPSTHHYALAHALISSYDLFYHYARAGSVEFHVTLSPELVAFDEELHSFVDEEDMGSTGLLHDRIVASLEHEVQHGRDGAADIQGVIDIHPVMYKRLDRCGDVARQLQANLRAAARLQFGYARHNAGILVSTMASKLARAADLVEQAYGVELQRGEHNMATLWWPGAPAAQLIRASFRVWGYGQTLCDRNTQKRVGFIPWPSDAWWRVMVMWMIYFAQWGHRDRLTRLPFHLGGKVWHPLHVTWLAHLDHTLPFFYGTLDLVLDTLDIAGILRIAASNATVQLTQVNFLIRGNHISVLLAIFQHGRRAGRLLAERLGQRSAFFRLTQAQLDDMEHGGPPIAAELVEYFRPNGGKDDNDDGTD